MEGSVVNQIEILGFEDEKSLQRFRKKLKSLKSHFNLTSLGKDFSFVAEEASIKVKDSKSLTYLFISEEIHPADEIKKMAELYSDLEILHLIIAPSGEGYMCLKTYKEGNSQVEEVRGSIPHMIGSLLQGGFQ